MRILFRCLLVLLIALPSTTRCEDLIPGVVSFDPPPFLTGYIPQNVPGEIRQYGSPEPRTGLRYINIMLKEIGASNAQENGGGTQKLSDNALRTSMQSMVDSTRNATNISRIVDRSVGNQTALFVSYNVIQRHWVENPDAVFSFELYWIRMPTNRVLEIKLVADTQEHLETLKPCLKTFKVTTAQPTRPDRTP